MNDRIPSYKGTNRPSKINGDKFRDKRNFPDNDQPFRYIDTHNECDPDTIPTYTALVGIDGGFLDAVDEDLHAFLCDIVGASSGIGESIVVWEGDKVVAVVQPNGCVIHIAN